MKSVLEPVHRSIRVAALTLAVSVASFAVHALDPPHLDQFPPVATVIADNQGSDRFDTLARQQAALTQLARAIPRLAGEREFCCQTPDETEVAARYQTEAQRIRREAFDALPNDQPANPFRKSEQQEWSALQYRYEQDGAFRAANFGRYLGPPQIAALGAAYADSAEALDPNRVGLTGSSALAANAAVLGAFLLLLLALVREFMKFGSTTDALKVRAGFASHRLKSATGIVTGYGKREETWETETERTDPFGSVSRTFTRRTYTYESFTLKGPKGEHHVQIMDANLDIPNGHLATAVWATRSRKDGGSYVLFFDRTAAQTRPVAYGIGKMLRVRLWVLLPLFAIAILLGAAAKVIFADSLRLVSETFIGLGAVFIMWIVAMIWINRVVIPRRTRRFVKNDAPRVLASIEKQETRARA
jgi:hypothetical protein